MSNTINVPALCPGEEWRLRHPTPSVAAGSSVDDARQTKATTQQGLLCTAWTVVLAEVAVHDEGKRTKKKRHCHSPRPEGEDGLGHEEPYLQKKTIGEERLLVTVIVQLKTETQHQNKSLKSMDPPLDLFDTLANLQHPSTPGSGGKTRAHPRLGHSSEALGSQKHGVYFSVHDSLRFAIIRSHVGVLQGHLRRDESHAIPNLLLCLCPSTAM